MRRSRRGKINCFRNVISRQRTNPFIKIIGSFLISPVTHHCKVCLHHSRFDVRHSQRSIHQIDPESVRKSLHGSFRCAIHTPTRISGITGNRSDINNMSAPAFYHTGNHQTRHCQQSSYIRIDHDIPFIQVTLEFLIHTDHQPGVVHQHINRLPFFGQ